ncbi:MAG: hypothetical protein P1V51_16375 [Deltaproteobacteria bacterium]|nr:hypothetical protein [Deltaproteobacteria bacterium]
MKRSPRSWALIGLLLAACGGGNDSTLIISVNPQQVPGDGSSSATVTVRAIALDEPVKDGTTINVTCTGGTFEQGKETTTETIRTVGGEGTVTWYAPVVQGEYRISASYQDLFGKQKQAQTSVQVIEPTPIDGASFSFSCTASNVGVPRSGEDDLRLPCNVSARDRNGVDVPFDLNRFGVLTETGTLEVDANGDIFFVLSPGQVPKDTTPEGDAVNGEPRWLDSASGKTRNPRDGFATLVVHTNGTLTGAHDALQGEPYLDENDDGMWNPGESWFDADENGSYTPAGGAVGEGRIWRWVKILLTGMVSEQGPVDAGLGLWSTASGSLALDVPFGGTGTFSVILVDANLNPVASHAAGGTQDTIEPQCSNTSGAITPRQVQLDRDAAGVVFNPSTGAIDGRATRPAYTQGLTDYTFTLTNNLRSTVTAPEAWALERITVKRVPYPGARQITETLSPATAVSGDLLAP